MENVSRLSPPPRAVLFDLDGTLLHTSPDLAAAANAALSDLSLPSIPAAIVETFVGKGIDTLMRRCLDHLGAGQDAQLFDRARQAYMRRYAEQNGILARPYPGVLAGLEMLRAAEVPLGVCTNKAGAFTLPLLERAGLSTYFKAVICGDTTPRRKPHPDMILAGAGALGASAHDLLMVGDSVNDAAAARAAGCPVWIVPYGYNEGRPVQEIDCDGIVRDLEHVALLLCGSSQA
ncbi:MAG: phosphoglycolate phosphatase [Burkholderiales bacterium]